MQVDQDLDQWPDTDAHVVDALRHYYYAFLSSTAEAVQVCICVFPLASSTDHTARNGLSSYAAILTVSSLPIGLSHSYVVMTYRIERFYGRRETYFLRRMKILRRKRCP